MKSVPNLNLQQQIAGPDGRPTVEFVKWALFISDALREQQGFAKAVGEVSGPSGGSTADAEARTAIEAIIDAAP